MCGVGKPTRKGREELGGPTCRLGQVGRPSGRAQRSWEALPESQKRSEGPPVGPGGVGRPSRRTGWCREALLEGQERSVGPPGGPERVRKLSQTPGGVGKDVWSWEAHQKGEGGVGRPYLQVGTGWEALK